LRVKGNTRLVTSFIICESLTLWPYRKGEISILTLSSHISQDLTSNTPAFHNIILSKRTISICRIHLFSFIIFSPIYPFNFSTQEKRPCWTWERSNLASLGSLGLRACPTLHPSSAASTYSYATSVQVITNVSLI
jgi:hypothetical protein